MVATASPFGARAVKSLASRYNSTGSNLFPIANGYATNIFAGDFVVRVADGTIEKATGTTTLSTIGIFIGAEYTEPNLNYRLRAQFYPANTVGVVGGVDQINGYVIDDPEIVFKIQADGPIALADVGSNAAIVQGAGSIANGNSTNALDQSSLATTSTLPLRILEIERSPENVAGDAFTDVLVKFNTGHQYLNTTGV
ncbi:MAG: hypothetical protein V6Z86_05730 [Hyphomicrobiales bacterium]